MSMSQPGLVRSLRGKARREWEQLCKHPPNPRIYPRAMAGLVSAEGKTTPEIGQAVRRDHSTVFRWLKQFDRVGIPACTPGKSSGRPPKIDADAKQVLQETVRQNPRDLGYLISRWTTPVLAQHLAATHHVTVHPATIGDALHGLGYRYGCPKLDLKHRQDPVEVARARRQRNRALKKLQPARMTSPSCTSTKPNSI
jgi:transposase